MSFVHKAEPGSKVFIAGSFNAWSMTAHELKEIGNTGHFHRAILLLPGRYEYKFVVDGTWQIDADCPNWSPNRFGSLNSVVDVSKGGRK